MIGATTSLCTSPSHRLAQPPKMRREEDLGSYTQAASSRPQGGVPPATGGVDHTCVPASITSTLFRYCIMPFLPPKEKTLW